MSAKQTRKEKSRKGSAPWLDRGAIMGGFAATVVLGLWLLVYLGEREPEKETKPAPNRPETPSTLPAQADENLPPKAVEPAYMQGIRDAIALGKEGIADSKDALKWNEEVGGDPFKFANMLEEAAAKVTRASTALEGLREDAKDDRAALKRIDEWQRYFDDNFPRRKK